MTNKKNRYTVHETRDWSYGHEHVYYWVADAKGGEACGWVRSRQMARDVAAMLNKTMAKRK